MLQRVRNVPYSPGWVVLGQLWNSSTSVEENQCGAKSFKWFVDDFLPLCFWMAEHSRWKEMIKYLSQSISSHPLWNIWTHPLSDLVSFSVIPCFALRKKRVWFCVCQCVYFILVRSTGRHYIFMKLPNYENGTWVSAGMKERQATFKAPIWNEL